MTAAEAAASGTRVPAPRLAHEMDLHFDLDVVESGPGPFGHRVLATVTGGTARGDRIDGAVVGAGGDWLLIGPDGWGRLDVRGTIRTHDGAHLYAQYSGVMEVTPAMQDLLGGGGGPTDYGDQYFFTNPRLETGDERYGWVNRTMFLGQGRLIPGLAVEYRVYRVDG